jgi:hypothetical protein
MKLQSTVIAILFSALLAPAFAARQVADEGGGMPDPVDEGGNTDTSDPVPDPACAQHASANVSTSPATIALGQSATVSWSATLPPEHCAGARVSIGVHTIGAQGSMWVKPMSNRSYAISVNGVRLAQAELNVTLPSTVKIKESMGEWKDLLVQAVGTPNTRVVLADTVDMDLSGHQGIFIARGVTFTSEAPKLAAPTFGPLDDVLYRGPARDARHLGPRVYTRTRAHPLFEIKCFAEHGDNGAGDNVRIDGFRLHGPDFGTPVGSDHKDRGIMVTGCRGIEIANMEVAGWSGQAIYVQDLSGSEVSPPGRISRPDEIRIHGNFFHHNQQETGGEGYGVEVKSGAYALIEHNVFDFNRHAIAAGGEDGTGYIARLNLVLKGGGVHNWHAGISWFTHQFDVHGLETYLGYDACCGQAGERFEFTNNSFQYTQGNAIKVRGNPTDRALAHNNVFAHEDRDDAIAQNGNPGFGDNITNPIQVTGNAFGADTYGQYGVCDIDGDGRDDLFLATGASWWYSSAGRMHWTYLRDDTTRRAQLGLGDFNGDGHCDVFRANLSAGEWQISSGGSDAWIALPGTYDVPFEELAFGDFNGDGVTDVFRRAPDGQWWAISPGVYDWKPLQSSSFPLSELRFGHFNEDRVTDVIAVQGGRWSVSWGGTTEWAPLNTALGFTLKWVVIGDIDHNGIDDIVRYRVTSTLPPHEKQLLLPERGVWEVSWDGRGDWTEIKALAWKPDFADPLRATRVRGFIGGFRGVGRAELLSVDYTRIGLLYKPEYGGFVGHSLYAY